LISNSPPTGEKPDEFLARIENDAADIWGAFIDLIASRAALKNYTSWPTLLKSGQFYRDAIQFLRPSWVVK
jgi:hypothetical protein